MPDPDKDRIRPMRRCEKCGAILTKNWERTGAHGLTRDVGGDGYWGKDCPYLECDDPDCRALRHPMTVEDYRIALVHWRDHTLGGGCSHGC